MSGSNPQAAVIRAYAQMHLAVVLYGFTAILGDLITLSGTVLVWYRLLIAGLSFLLLPGMAAGLRRLRRADWLRLGGIGLLMAVHWITFYEAIKYSNASITLACLASTSFFTSIAEPLILRRPARMHELLLGVLVIAGFVFIFGFAGRQFATGMVIALISAAVISVAGVLNKLVVDRYSTFTLSFVEFSGGWLLVSALLPLNFALFPEQRFLPQGWDLPLLLILSLACTTWAYTMTMNALRHVSAYTATLAINLEPVYGIILANLILNEGEALDRGFYIGTGFILTAVFLHPVLSRLLSRRPDAKHPAAQQPDAQ
ncbi:MAG: DMT family transporter [Bacteroidia bacterium]|nr:DMT family transporter [Bacteroidia bacterium]